MKRSEIIGGEFEVAYHPFISNQGISLPPSYTTFSSGRAALYAILEQNTIKDDVKFLLVPDYICFSVIDVAERAGYTIKIYAVDDDLNPDYQSVQSVYTGVELFLLVNYYGLIDVDKVVCTLHEIDQDMMVILDNVQAPFAMNNPLNVNYAFTSFRKSFPCPDGGCGIAKLNKLPQYERISSYSQLKLAGTLLKGVGIHNEIFDSIYLHILEKGESLIDEDYHTDMSLFSKYILEHLNYSRIRLLRQRNAKFVVLGLKQMGINPLISFHDDAVPFFIPITLSNRDKVRKALFENNIFCPVHWPLVNSKYKLKRGAELAKTELSLIVDQRYNCADMEIMLEVIESNM